MNKHKLTGILQQYKQGNYTLEDVIDLFKETPDEEDLGFVKIDHHRPLRKGFPEVVYCEGKTSEQVVEIMNKLVGRGDGNIIATRANLEVYKAVKQSLPAAEYYPLPRMITLIQEQKQKLGNITVVSAGTSDMPVSEEAAITAEVMGNNVEKIYDVGVAGIHRLLKRQNKLSAARVLIVVAGMEGALPSVVGGLVSVPVIAVPTSVGYGASFNGLAALLAMLNSCSSGVTVVNIDNGFGAGYAASLINQIGVK